MKKREKLLIIVGFFVMFMSFNFVLADEITLGRGNTRDDKSYFHKLADAEGLTTGATYHFSPEEQTARKLCELTETNWEDLGLDHSYPNYVSHTLDAFSEPSGDSIHKWATEWETINAVDDMLWEVICEGSLNNEKSCAVDYPGQCGEELDNGIGGTINCSDNCGDKICISDYTCCTPLTSSNCSDFNYECGDHNVGCELEDTFNCGECDLDYNCIAGICTNLPGTVFWRNMKGVTTNHADIGDSVLMVFLNANSNYDFEIYEEDLSENINWFNDEIRIGSESLESMLILGDINMSIAEWIINEDDFDAGNSIEDAEFSFDNNEEFYFIANELGSSLLYTSKSQDNSMPYADLVIPEHGSMFNIYDEVFFRHASFDEDDDLNLIWDFGDNEKQSFTKCITSARLTGGCNTTHQYLSSGTKMINLTVQESNVQRNPQQKANDLSRIYIFKEGLNVFAIIDKPDYKVPVVSGGEIEMDGRNSHVVDCYLSSIECDNSKPAEKNCFTVPSEIDKTLYCYRYKESNDLQFQWRFKDGEGNLESDADHTNHLPFEKYLLNTQRYTIYLTVTDTEENIQDSTQISITIEGGRICSDNGRYWEDYTTSPITELSTINGGNCYYPEASDGQSYCCPSGYQCKPSGKGTDSKGIEIYECIYTSALICKDLETEEECTNYTSEIAKRTIESIGEICGRYGGIDYGDEFCWEESICSCIWNSTEEECYGLQENLEKCDNIQIESTWYGNCTWITESNSDDWEEQCNTNGQIEIKFIGIWNGPPGTIGLERGCESKGQIISCQKVVKLNFFEKINFIISILIVFLIYFIYLRES